MDYRGHEFAYASRNIDNDGENVITGTGHLFSRYEKDKPKDSDISSVKFSAFEN